MIGQFPVFEMEIPFSVRAVKLTIESKSIFNHDPKGKVAAAYETLTKELPLTFRTGGYAMP